MLGGIRAIREQARSQLHAAMSFPARYIETPGASPRAVTVRHHNKMITQGDVKGTSFGYAEIEETDPFLVFLRSEVQEPRRGAVVVVSESEAYRVEHSMQPDGLTIKAKVLVLPEDEAAAIYPTAG